MGNCVGKTATTIDQSSCEPSVLRFQNDFDKGECIGQGGFGKVYRCKSRIDEHDYAIKEIRLKKENTKEVQKHIRECRSHAQLIHPNIVRYYDDWIEDASDPVPTYILYVKMELYNCTLESFLDQRMSSDDDSASYTFRFETIVMNCLFSAVSYLHVRDIVHCDINPSNIFIKITKDNGLDRILLGNFSLARQVPLTVSSKRSNSDETNFPERSKWSFKNETLFSAPEQSSYNYRKPVDVYSAGVVVYDLFNYVKTKNERYVMLNEFRNSHVVSENIREKFESLATLISMMCDKKAKQRPTMNEVLAYIFKNKIRDDNINPWGFKFPQGSQCEDEFISHLATDDNQDQDQFRITTVHENDNIHQTSAPPPLVSRYETSFIKGECIGQGGYGKVYECMSRVDKQNYAIKELRLKINDTEEIEKQLRECRHHAQLIHPNIVRYYDAWVEKTLTPFPFNVLYIKMELCHGTLEKFIDQRMASTDDAPYNFDFETRVVNSLFSAIAFLHLEGLMHRDIKPSNIFIKRFPNKLDDVLLGDFGLARPVQHLALPTSPSDDADVLASTNLSSSVGTFLYSAPELSSNNYDQRVDIYSAGIVIYDLFNNVKTKNDRLVMLNELRDNAAPSSEFYEKFPKLAPMIKLMMASVKKRHTIFALLPKYMERIVGPKPDENTGESTNKWTFCSPSDAKNFEAVACSVGLAGNPDYRSMNAKDRQRMTIAKARLLKMPQMVGIQHLRGCLQMLEPFFTLFLNCQQMTTLNLSIFTVVMYEVFSRVGSKNERIVMLNELRDQGKPSLECIPEFSIWAPVIRSMVSILAAKRPDSLTLLNQCKKIIFRNLFITS